MQKFVRLLTLVAGGCCLAVAAPPANVIDTNAAASAFSEAHQLCSADGGRLWGVSLCGPMMFIDPATHQAVANEAIAGGTLDGSIYRFVAPADVGVANTSLQYDGQRWTMILWPLPSDADARAVMLVHESYHRIQPVLQLEGSGGLGTNGYFDSESGRIWLRVEQHALQAALLAQGTARRDALRDAVALALYRRSLFPGAAEEERGLILNEGLAESTGIDVGLSADRRVAYAIKDLQFVESVPSYVRSFPYGLGPAYVELMDAREPLWRHRVTDKTDVTLLAATVYGIDARTLTEAQAGQIAGRYDGNEIIAQERERTKRLAVAQARYTSEFVNASVLTLPMKKFNITFNPSDVGQFGTHGSVYHTLQLTDAWGTLKVDGGDALISPAFDSVTVPRGRGLARGPGWTLQLAPTYSVVPALGAQDTMTVTKSQR